MNVSRIAVVLVLGVALASCTPASKSERTAERAVAAPTSDALCKAHSVLEAVCPKCNPALAAVFKAKGDWCGEHGFPESFCPICHPERGGRPAKDVSAANDAPADGTKVRLRTKDTARLAGLKFARAVSQTSIRELSATARIVYDAARVAEVNSRVSGVVRAIRADVGARVRAGAALAIIDSASIGAERSSLSAARTRLEVAQADLTRNETLQREGITAERNVLAARREVADARAQLEASQLALGMVGAGDDGEGRYTLISPLDGVVTQRSATIGRLITSDEPAFEVVDPSAMWIEIDVPETDLAFVAVGQPLVLELDSLPGRRFEAEISYVAPALDRKTRTAVARAPIANPDGALRANLYGRARIAVAAAGSAVLVPREAVQRARDAQLVFVRIADDLFEARRVSVEPADENTVRVSGRVAPGDEVVTEGSFLLKTETLKESIGAGCCEAD